MYYLVSYEQQELSQEQMNIELASICNINYDLSDIFD